MRKFLIIFFLLIHSTAWATDFTSVDKLYGVETGVASQFYQLWPDHKAQLEDELASPTKATVAALVASTVTVGETYYTQGFYTAGDGGAATYFIVTGILNPIPDGYVNHSVNSGTATAVLQYDGALDIRLAGASTTITTNQLPINAALAYAGVVEIPASHTFKTSAPVILNESYQGIIGYGASSLIESTVDDNVVVLDSDTPAAAIEYINLDNFAVTVSAGVTPTKSGVRLISNATTATGVSRSRISIHTFNVAKGISLDSQKLAIWGSDEQLNPHSFIDFTGIENHPDSDLDYGIYSDGGMNTHCKISENKLRGSIAVIKMGTGGDRISVGDIQIIDNVITGNGGKGIDIVGPSGVVANIYNQKITITGNDFDGTLTEAFSILDMSNINIGVNSGLDKDFTILPVKQSDIQDDGVMFTELRSVSSNVTVNNSTTIVPITELTFHVDVVSEGLFELDLRYSSSTVADIKIDFTAPSGAALKWAPVGGRWDQTKTFVTANEFSTGLEIPFYGSGGTRLLSIRGYFLTGSTGGDITVLFAQNTAEVSDTVILPLSNIKITRKRNNYNL